MSTPSVTPPSYQTRAVAVHHARWGDAALMPGQATVRAVTAQD